MSLYYNKKLISGVRDVPSMTLAQYNALTNKPKLWIRTDAPSGDRGINADDIQYDSNNSVKDKIDSLIIATVTGTISANDGDTDIAYPTGFNSTNSIVLNFEIYGNGTWRSGIGLFNSIGTSRTFTMLKTDYVSLYNNNADYRGKDLRIHLAKLQS